MAGDALQPLLPRPRVLAYLCPRFALPGVSAEARAKVRRGGLAVFQGDPLRCSLGDTGARWREGWEDWEVEIKTDGV